MNRSGAPANCWLLCLIYVCYLLNHIACTALDGKIPLLALTGITPDFSIILLFTFYQPVFYATYDQNFPSESEDRAGYWVGFGEHCGDFIRPRDEENPSGSQPMPTFDPSDLVGRTFLLPPEENGERHRAKVTRQVVEIIDQDNGQRVENINFILDIGNGKVEESISYNQVLEHLENAQDHDMGMDQELYRFRAIIGHQGPLLASDQDWKGSRKQI